METLREFNIFVKEITSNNSRNYKLDILNKYKDNETIKKYLYYVFNPYVVLGISDKKFERALENKDLECNQWDIDSMFRLISYLCMHHTGTDTDLGEIAHFYNHYIDEELKTLFKQILTKNLQLGIDVKSINKVYPNWIPVFSVQLANKYFDDPTKVEGKEFALTTKIDGMRCILMKENGVVTFWSRQGQQIEGLVDLVKEAEKFPDNICLDGELIAKETTKEDTYKNTMKTARTKYKEKHNLCMNVFDYLTVAEFKDQNSTQPYFQRRANLEQLFENKTYEYFYLLPILYKGKDTSKITEILNQQVANGEEGVMINILDDKYEFKRTNSLLKVKLMKSYDLEVVDYFEGENSNTGKLGGFVVRYKDGNLVKVGSGYSKEFREDAWTHPQDYIGKIIEVQYFEETENANGGLSLRFPVYLGIRESFDKSEPDF